jgi:DNA-binding transcriptional ArsR family regulator
LTIGRQANILKHVLNNVLDPELDLDRVFHALADPGRRRMLERLSQGPTSVSELGKPLTMSLAAVLQHVQVLEGSGLVQSRKTGRTRTCSLNAQTLRSAESWISERRTFVERQLDRLGEYLASTADQPDSGAAGPAAPHAPA